MQEEVSIERIMNIAVGMVSMVQGPFPSYSATNRYNL